VQGSLDAFVNYFNKRKIRSQPESPLPSNVTPTQIMACPADYQMTDCRINVPPQLVNDLRSRLPPKSEAYRWVSDEFEIEAQAAYDLIGRPDLVRQGAIKNAWNIFGQMAQCIATARSGAVLS
jgi:hypothetical protein